MRHEAGNGLLESAVLSMTLDHVSGLPVDCGRGYGGLLRNLNLNPVSNAEGAEGDPRLRSPFLSARQGHGLRGRPQTGGETKFEIKFGTKLKTKFRVECEVKVGNGVVMAWTGPLGADGQGAPNPR